MNKNPRSRQLVHLKSWNSKLQKPTDPHYSSRVTLQLPISRYIDECLENEENPELFLSLWIDETKGIASLGLAVPYEYVSPRNRASLGDFEEWE
jgi:hypothetical protein